MTPRFKDFGNGGLVEVEPLSFKLHDEEFRCLPQIQGKVLLDMVADSQGEDNKLAAELINRFFAKTLEPESFTRFVNLLESEKIVSVDTLGEIVSWMVEQYSSRPTLGSQDSQSGQ